jgi:presequence protease
VHGFKLESVERIDFFDINAYKLVHEATGARVLHLDSSDMDNVFAVLFRTPPDDHTGKPHILEHLATCGTTKYPVRDPFFNMIKRSLNTYMNAWTGSDFTMYPFSTTNQKDFNNLLSVYLEMAFFPRLDPLDFSQEGHRLEFKEWNDTSSELEYKGVVYNEMKGAMSNPEDAFVHKINENLF